MKNEIVRFFKEEDGVATVEIVLILCVLAFLAFMFREAIFSFFNKIKKAISDEINKITTAP